MPSVIKFFINTSLKITFGYFMNFRFPSNKKLTIENQCPFITLNLDIRDKSNYAFNKHQNRTKKLNKCYRESVFFPFK